MVEISTALIRGKPKNWYKTDLILIYLPSALFCIRSAIMKIYKKLYKLFYLALFYFGLLECIWIRKKMNNGRFPYMVLNKESYIKRKICRILITIYSNTFFKKYHMVHIYLHKLKRTVHSSIQNNILFFGNYTGFSKVHDVENNTIISPSYKVMWNLPFEYCNNLKNCNIFRLGFFHDELKG